MTADWPNPDAREDVPKSLAAMPFAKALGVEVVSVERGSVTLEAPLTAAFEAPPGCFAASSIGALGDMAAMTSIATELPKGAFVTTLDFTVKMLGLSKGARLRAVGQTKQVGKTTAVGSADVFLVTDEGAASCGTVLASGRIISAATG